MEGQQTDQAATPEHRFGGLILIRVLPDGTWKLINVDCDIHQVIDVLDNALRKMQEDHEAVHRQQGDWETTHGSETSP